VGAFPDHEKEGFRLFWLSMWATFAVAVAAAALLLAFAARNKRRFRLVCIVLYAIALGAAAIFCIWYYRVELRRISPDFFGVGLASSWLDQLSGAAMLAIVISAAAYRTATTDNLHSTKDARLCDGECQIYLHEYVVFILLLLGAPLDSLYEQFRTSFGDWTLRLNWQQQIAYVVADVLSRPETYLNLAVLIFSIQLLWRRWKHRAATPAWKLMPIDQLKFAQSWAALALLAAVGLPTLSIFSFTYWLGPWYLHGP
jgi:hypothetical protein